MVSRTKLLVVCHGLLVGLVAAPTVLTIPVPVQMISLATLIIIISSFNAAEAQRQRKLGVDNGQARDTIGREQAWRFPIVASAALFGMFLAFKYLPKEWVSMLLTLYGIGFGAMAMAALISPMLASIPSVPAFAVKEYGLKDIFTLSLCDVTALALSSPVAYWYFATKNWLPNNILAVSLALSAVDALALGDFVSGVVLLCGLFFYDVFWVFFSKQVFGANVMVSVAKQFEGPIKLIFPRFVGADANNMSMLGLGDIVIPGLFVALTLRFDTRNRSPSEPLSTSPLPYFWSTTVAYVSGLIATVVALNVYGVAQPALLYLVPACLITPMAYAIAKGELKSLISYAEEEPKPKTSDTKTEAKSEGLKKEE